MKQTGQLPTSTSKLGKIHGILVGKHADVTHALVLAAQKAKHGGYGQYGLIYVLQLPGQIEWSVIALPDGGHFPLWRRAVLELPVKTASVRWGSDAESEKEIDEEWENALISYHREQEARQQAAQQRALKLGKFTEDEVWEAAETGIFPPDMTVQHLITTWHEPRMKEYYVHIIGAHSALHLAASKGHFPKGTTFSDLLVFEGKDCEDCVRWLFKQITKDTFTYPADTTAQALAEVPNARFGDYLNLAANFGVLPPGTSTADLSKVKQLKITDDNFIKELAFKNYAAPLHFAAVGGKLLPGTSAKELQVHTPNGPTPWDVAVNLFSVPYSQGYCLKNIIACPDLCNDLQPAHNGDHLNFIQWLLASPNLTNELREQIGQYKHLVAYLL